MQRGEQTLRSANSFRVSYFWRKYRSPHRHTLVSSGASGRGARHSARMGQPSSRRTREVTCSPCLMVWFTIVAAAPVKSARIGDRSIG